jgi:hypothetical protein
LAPQAIDLVAVGKVIFHDADSHLAASNSACHPCPKAGCFERGPAMGAQNWIIAAVVVLLIVAGYFFLRPTAETPTAPPATTEQPAQPAPAN